MPLFSRRKETEVQSFMLKLLNNNCAELEAMIEGPRLDRRVNLTIVVLVVPFEKGRLQIDRTFATVTKGFSTTGVSLVLNEPKGLDEVILGFRWEMGMKFVLARAKHLNPMGAGFYQVGMQMVRVVHPDEHSELQSLCF
ncbi:MAG: hypothetical protein HUU20_24435 [Pirellulales bacterium]|nr:hypothetical protein [Pirellulales bacterium]